MVSSHGINLEAIDCSISFSNPEAALERFGGGDSHNFDDEHEENDKEKREQHQLFQTKFEEGHDLPDPYYLDYLRDTIFNLILRMEIK